MGTPEIWYTSRGNTRGRKIWPSADTCNGWACCVFRPANTWSKTIKKSENNEKSNFLFMHTRGLQTIYQGVHITLELKLFISVVFETFQIKLYRLDVSYQVCLWDQSQVPIVRNTRETGNIHRHIYTGMLDIDQMAGQGPPRILLSPSPGCHGHVNASADGSLSKCGQLVVGRNWEELWISKKLLTWCIYVTSFVFYVTWELPSKIDWKNIPSL